MKQRTPDPARWGKLLLLAVVMFGVGVRFALLPKETARTPDERVYARQAEMVQAQGVHGFAVLGDELDQNPASVAMYPSPLRAGWIALLTGFTALTDESPMAAGSGLSFVCSVATLLLLAWMGVRFFGTTAAVCATLLLAVFPFDLVVYQRVWQESFCSLLGLATVAVTLLAGTVRGRRRLWFLCALALLGVVAFTVKENSGMLFVLCGAGLALHFWLHRERRTALQAVAAVMLAAVLSVMVLSSLFGGPFHFIAMYREYAHLRGNNPYSAQYETGPGWWVAAGLWQASRGLCVGFVLGFAIAAWRAARVRRAGNVAWVLGYAATAVFTLGLPLLTGLNFRYIAPVFGVLCFLGGVGVTWAMEMVTKQLSPSGKRVAWSVAGVLLTVGAARDLHLTQAEWIGRGMPDLAVRTVREMSSAP